MKKDWDANATEAKSIEDMDIGENLTRLGIEKEFSSIDDEQAIVHKWDWCACLFKNSEGQYKYVVMIREMPKIILNGTEEEQFKNRSSYGAVVTQISLIDDNELLEWMALINYEVSNYHPHVKVRDLYVKHKVWDVNLGFMLKTDSDVNIQESKTCELMIADNSEEDPKDIIVLSDSYEVVCQVKLPPPLSLGSVERNDEPGPISPLSIAGTCWPGRCTIGLCNGDTVTEDLYLFSYHQVYVTPDKSSGMSKAIASKDFSWFNHCPECGSMIKYGHIAKRADKYKVFDPEHPGTDIGLSI